MQHLNLSRLFALLPVIFIICATLTPAFAQPMAEADIPVRCNRWQVVFEVNPDGSYTESQTWSMTTLKESALEGQKTASVSFSTSVAKGEVLEAYTLKKSGKRIDAPKSSFQLTANDGYNSASPLYSDQTTISVVFPDLAVGDTTNFAFRIKNTEGIFPNQFSAAQFFSRFLATDDISVKVIAPKDMKLSHASFFLTEKKPVQVDGKQILEWSYRNPKPEKWTPAESGIYAVGEEPSLFVSTFADYGEISRAYGRRATPKAAPSERIKTLAAQIAGDKQGTEGQARAIYDWVARNITYVGNGIGIGRVVPRDLDVVLDNRMGDCKDHATLLQALLAARGIECDQMLVNADSRYDLPKVPVVGIVNHVINYVPALKLYLDSTAATVPFGMLPQPLGEKPVLPVANFQDAVKTPSTAQYGHEQVMRTRVKINPDGSATGTTQFTLKGLPAVKMRQVMRALRGDQEELLVRKILERQGMHGSGTLTKDDPTDLLDSYSFSITFQIEDLLTLASTTGMPIKPVVSSVYPIDSFVSNAYEPTPKKSTNCSGGRSSEEYVYEFPPSMNVVGFPRDYRFSSKVLEYQGSYHKSENVLTVKRTLEDRTSGNVCSPEYVADYQKSSRAILRDLRSQVLISN